MLFKKDMEPRCAYCARGAKLDDDSVLCVKRGCVPLSHACRNFRYDPLKRVPPKLALPDFSRLDQEDFTL